MSLGILISTTAKEVSRTRVRAVWG